jgi:gentisate 1,2-dioxygenase
MTEEYIQAYEYEKNVNPKLSAIQAYQKNVNEFDFGISFINFSELFNVDYKATTPNLLASFIKIKNGDNVTLKSDLNENSYNDVNATSNLFYILQGNSQITIDDEEFTVFNSDILISPLFNTISIKNVGSDDLHIYYINDSPLVNYLGSKPCKKIFKSAVYPIEFLMENLNKLSNPNNNRKGILLSNKDTEKIGTNTITPVLWALFNELPPNTIQRPHKHNSVALDLCINCIDSENVYTLMGEELDENGDIVNPTKINWKKGEMFITPPGLWHSHNNTGETFAYILPIQDAGLLLYQRILGIVLK